MRKRNAKPRKPTTIKERALLFFLVHNSFLAGDISATPSPERLNSDRRMSAEARPLTFTDRASELLFYYYCPSPYGLNKETRLALQRITTAWSNDKDHDPKDKVIVKEQFQKMQIAVDKMHRAFELEKGDEKDAKDAEKDAGKERDQVGLIEELLICFLERSDYAEKDVFKVRSLDLPSAALPLAIKRGVSNRPLKNATKHMTKRSVLGGVPPH